MVALAYWLGVRAALRHGDAATATTTLLWGTILFVVPGKLIVFALFRVYHKLWRFVDQKDFEAIFQAVAICTAGLVVALFLFSPGGTDPPRGVIALDFLLTLSGVGGVRFFVRTVLVERSFRAPLGAKDGREVLVVGAGNGGQSVAFELRRNPELRAGADRLRGRRPAQAGHAHGRRQGAGHHRRSWPRCSTIAEPDEVIIAIPSAPGELRQRVVSACRERAHPGAHAAHGLRDPARRREPHAPGARGARGGRAGPRAGAHGDRPRGPLPGGRDGARHRRGRLDRRGAVPPDRARRAAPADPRGRTARTASSRSGASWRRAATSTRAIAVLADCKDATRMRELFVEHAPDRGVPRRRLQARAADGGEPDRGRAQQRRGHAHRRVGRGRVGRAPLRARVHRQGRDAPPPSWARRRRSPSGPSRRRSTASRGRATPPCASATCSARRARWCRSSAARSPRAGP